MYNLYKNIQGFTPVKIIIKYKLEKGDLHILRVQMK